MTLQNAISLIENAIDVKPRTKNKVKRHWSKKIYKRTSDDGYKHRKVAGANSFNQIVHHKDSNKNNNSPSNLEVMSRAKHTAIELPAKRYKKNVEYKGRHKKTKGKKLEHHAHGLSRKEYMEKYYQKYPEKFKK